MSEAERPQHFGGFDPRSRARMREVALARFRDSLAWEHQAAAYVRLWRELLSRRLERYKAGSPVRQSTPDTAMTNPESSQTHSLTLPSRPKSTDINAATLSRSSSACPSRSDSSPSPLR